MDYYLDHIFDQIDENIKLDDEQKQAVTADDQYSLIIAGAGTGKTTTVTAKVKFLVEKRGIDPEKILVMSYTKKATEELRRRINVDFEIPAYVTTFHSLGYKYFRLLHPDKRIVPIDSNFQNKIFLDYLKARVFNTPNNIKKMVELFNDQTISWGDPRKTTYGPFFKENFSKFHSFDEYFDAYIQKKLTETYDIPRRVNDITDAQVNAEYPRTIKNEFTKSKGEAIIANFLYCNNIDYHYEKVYKELVDEDNATYRPDFTMDIGGEKIYIEFFGLSGNSLDNHSYQKIRAKKEAYHQQHKNKFIALDYKKNRGYLQDLKNKLEEYGTHLKPRSWEEIYRQILQNNTLAEFFNFKDFIFDTITTIKSSEKARTEEEIKTVAKNTLNHAMPNYYNLMKEQYDWFMDFWEYYKSRCQDGDIWYIDFNDMVTIPTSKLNQLEEIKMIFDYVIVDEYQDISARRYELLRATVDRCNSKLAVVGDDWQSIYSFMGGKIRYIYDFDHYFPGAEKYLIRKTYRNSQSLINIAGHFIMKNASQVKKQLESHKDQAKPIEIITCNETNDIDKVKNIIKAIHRRFPDDSIGLLAYTNNNIKTVLRDPDLIDSAENKVKIKGANDFYFDLLTIHKSKGLTYDWIIVTPLNKNFPKDPPHKFWLHDIFYNLPEAEKIEYPEFRRLFYVAITRARKKVILMASEIKTKRSRYINEIEPLLQENDNLS